MHWSKEGGHVVTAPKRPPTKADLVNEWKNLQKLDEVLEDENNINLNRIQVLEERVCELQNQNYLSDHKFTNISEFYKQRKQKHLRFLSQCRNDWMEHVNKEKSIVGWVTIWTKKQMKMKNIKISDRKNERKNNSWNQRTKWMKDKTTVIRKN